MKEQLYRRMQKRLDRFSMGFPETASGIELKILERLFSESDAELFLEMSPQLETPESVAARVRKPVEDIAARLDDMARRGLLFRVGKKGLPRYAAMAFVHGIFEFQVKDLDPELAEMVGRYFEEGFDKTLQEGAEFFVRTVPVQRSVDAAQHIATYEDAAALLREKTDIVVAECICRKRTNLLNKGCGKPLEVCFMFGAMGQYYLDRGMGRKIEAEEAVEILSKCHEAGLVTQPATSQNPGGMCNCCGDCCGVLEALNKHPKPAEKVFSNHLAVVDREACTGCETCLERCQMGALSMAEDGLAEVNLDRCIGCGLCVTTCPAEALKLVPKAESERRVPPATTAEQMMAMAQKRGMEVHL